MPFPNYFHQPFQAIGIRILPTAPENGTIALRIELKGCRHECKYWFGWIEVWSVFGAALMVISTTF